MSDSERVKKNHRLDSMKSRVVREMLSAKDYFVLVVQQIGSLLTKKRDGAHVHSVYLN